MADQNFTFVELLSWSCHRVVYFAREHGHVTIGEAIKLDWCKPQYTQTTFSFFDRARYLHQCGSGQVCGMACVNLIASSVPEGAKIRRLLDLVHA
ncbi:MAG: hypothetical protein Q8L97_08670 [Nitrosomonas sp.]|uniref:hypothetical protein n=1 Tax=Nitrosomonas sp. TaxID=42353 RepID=UPI00272FA301|nr:hypothetical protein [Nitrosomonas sp.]MDP1550217.1 hypothetical protein [Nitrosomonas sp.]